MLNRKYTVYVLKKVLNSVTDKDFDIVPQEKRESVIHDYMKISKQIEERYDINGKKKRL